MEALLPLRTICQRLGAEILGLLRPRPSTPFPLCSDSPLYLGTVFALPSYTDIATPAFC